MTPKQAKELLPIITAFSEGKKIQFYSTTYQQWNDVINKVEFSFPPYYYRIKPEPLLAKAYLTKKSVKKWEIEHNWDWIEKQDFFWKWVSEPFEIKEL